MLLYSPVVNRGSVSDDTKDKKEQDKKEHKTHVEARFRKWNKRFIFIYSYMLKNSFKRLTLVTHKPNGFSIQKRGKMLP